MNITDYIELPEAILLFLSEAIKINFALLVFLFSVGLGAVKEIRDVKRGATMMINWKAYAIIYITLALIYSGYYSISKLGKVSYLILLILLLFLGAIVFIGIIRKSIYVRKGSENLKWIFIIGSLYFNIIYGFLSYLQLTQERRSEDRRINYVFLMNDGSVIKSDSFPFFIGQTKGYIFLYNPKDSDTHVFQRKDIKEKIFSPSQASILVLPNGLN